MAARHAKSGRARLTWGTALSALLFAAALVVKLAGKVDDDGYLLPVIVGCAAMGMWFLLPDRPPKERLSERGSDDSTPDPGTLN